MSWKETWRLETIEDFKERKFNHYAVIPNFKKILKDKHATISLQCTQYPCIILNNASQITFNDLSR
jgi:hypothetical protein